MTSINHHNNLCLVTLPSLTSSVASPTGSAPSPAKSTESTTREKKSFEDIKNDITEQLSKLPKAIEQLENESPNDPSKGEKATKLSSKLEALKTVDKLCDFANELTKTNNNNILNNLCTGLEKFLGFNSASKGYTGEGIVYSDLDRLCDGVMGFLYGVLGAVKNENEVTTYDKYITVKNGKLANVLDSLKKSIGQGHSVLHKQIVDVCAWINSYHYKLEMCTGDLTHKLGELSYTIANTHFISVSGKESSPLTRQLEHWKATLKTIETIIQTIETNHINAFDNSLKCNLMHEMNVIHSSVAMLRESAANDIIQGQVVTVDEELVKQYFSILKEIRKLRLTKIERFGLIKNALKDARNFLSLDFDNAYKHKIWAYFNAVQNVVSELHHEMTVNKIALADLIRQMQSTLHELADNFERRVKVAVRKDLEHLESTVGNIASKITSDAGSSLVRWQSKKLEHAKANLEKITGAKGRDSTEDSGNLEVLFDKHIKQHLSSLVQNVYDKIGEIGRDSGLNGSTISDILINIKREVHSIIHGKANKGLKGIIEATQIYASTFQSKYQGAVWQMAEKIVDENALIIEHVDQYVSDNHAQHPKLNKDGVKSALKRYVFAYIREIVRQAADTAKLSFASDLSELARNIGDFAAYVETKLMSKLTVDATAAEAVTQMQPYLPLSHLVGSSVTHNDTSLRKAIRTVFVGVKSAVEETAKELKRFILDTNIGNVGTALSTAHLLDEKLHKANANAVDNRLSALKNAVGEKLNEKFTSSVKHNLSDAVNQFNTAAISQIKEAATTAIAVATSKVTAEMAKFDGAGSGTDHLKAVLAELKKQFNELENYMTSSNGGHIDRKITDIQNDVDTLNGIQMANGVIDKHKQEADGKMNDLKNHLYEQLKSIGNVVSQADKALMLAIEAVESTLKDSFQLITGEVRKLFARQKITDIKAFQKLLDTQKSKIESMIYQDKTTGIKGFIRKMRTWLEQNKEFGKLHAKIEFKPLASNIEDYIDYLLENTEDQVKTSFGGNSSEKLGNHQSKKVGEIRKDVDKLLTHLKNPVSSPRTYIFDHKFTTLLSHLSSSLSLLHPSAFANPRHPELLDAVRQGLRGFVKELGKVYVNGYEGHKETINWDNKQSNDGDYCARIALTVFTILDRDIVDLKHSCLGRWKSKNIRLYDKAEHEKQHENVLGSWFKNCGYKVSDDERTHNGELDREKTGEKISALCSNNITGLQGAAKRFVEKYYSTTNGIQLDSLLRVLYTMVDKYYRASHLRHIPRAKLPTTIYQMLHWFVGLQWNPMYDKLTSYLRNWFAEFLKEHDLKPGELQVSVPARRSPSMVRSLTAGEMEQVFSNVIVRANKTLIALLGHGQEKGRYACDFNTNPDDLCYPSDAGKCFELLIEMCFRLNHQARFLYKQCQNYATQGGWRDCWYGRGIAGSGWNCNELQSPDRTCNQTANQTRNQTPKQTPNQNGNQHLICGVKSPLQSYLEDGLPGFLPHHFSKSNCQITCDLPNHRGIPCKTPMGFRDIGIAASITGRGQDIKDVLEDFCGTRRESMNLLCAYFLCLLRRPPTTLCDMFSFYYNFLDHWDKAGKEHKKTAFDQAVNGAYFGAEYAQLDVTKVLGTKEHKEDNHPKGDLFGILYCDPETTSYPPCGRYVQSISDDIRLLYTKKHAGVYLSWIVYMTETFYDLLKKLYDDCCRKCGNGGSKCHTKCCTKTCTVKYVGDDGKSVIPSKGSKHDVKCSSIVKCQDTHPTLYTYGFTFGSPYKLSGATNYDKQKRTCKDLCGALEIILGKDSALIELRHQIDNFLWAIREYFSYTALAFWSASFLYLLYVYIGRLDTLHIRSHLRIPSSHKITAQSLLAAARIGRLSKIAYLQP